MDTRDIKAYIKFLLRNKLYTFVSVVGFSISLMFVILLSIYVKQELSVDNFQENKDRIYQLTSEGKTYTSIPIAPYVKEKYPEIESFVRVATQNTYVSKEGQEEKIFSVPYFVDSTFFQIFSFPLLEGDKNTVLENEKSVVLSETFSIKIFGNTNTVGKILHVDHEDYAITGIVKDFPKNSQFKNPDYLININAIKKYWGKDIMTSYRYANSNLYFLAHKGTDLKKKEEALLADFKENYPIYQVGALEVVTLIPVDKCYFDVTFNIVENMRYNSRSTVSIYMGIALLILIIAILNYVNMTVAQAGFRGKEAAVKKLLGCDSSKIIVQQVIESIFITAITFIIGLGLALLVEPFVDDVLSTKLYLIEQFTPTNILFMVTAIIAIALLSCLVPTLVINNFKPIEVVKGTFKRKVKSSYSKILIIFQYTVSLVLIICSLFIMQQTDFLKNKDLGFENEQIVLIMNTTETSQRPALRSDLKNIVGVEGVTFSMGTPLAGGNIATYKYEDEMLSFFDYTVDSSFFSVYGVKLESTGVPMGKDTYWVNEKANKALEPYTTDYTFTQHEKTKRIAGVFNDFYTQPLHVPMSLITMTLATEKSTLPYISLKLSANSDKVQTIDKIKSVYSQYNGNKPIEIAFGDEKVQAFYEKETKISKVMSSFTLLTIVITIMGVFAMSLYMVRQKEKEIGIRKVNGATENEVLWMLNKQSLTRVLISFTTACPIAYYATTKWLENFAYKININILTFVIAGLSIALLTLISVSYMTWKAAKANPVDSLKSE